MRLSINGEDREFPELDSNARLSSLVDLLKMKADRIAIERNREIVPRSQWEQMFLANDDRLEIVQFVGGGVCSRLDSAARVSTHPIEGSNRA